MRKINLKNKSLKGKGYAYVDDKDFSLPISTQGLTEASVVLSQMEGYFNVPLSPDRPATSEQIKKLKNAGYDVSKQPVLVKTFDETSKKYKEMKAKESIIYKFLDISLHIDLSYGDEGEKIYQQMGLESDTDYIGAALWLSELGMFESDIELLKMQIQEIKDRGVKSYDEYESGEVDTDEESS